MAFLSPGDTIMGMELTHGGHLTHGHPLNISGKYYKVMPYGVRRDTEQIDYDQAAALALEHQPKVIMIGASAYPRFIDFAGFREICDSVGARDDRRHGAHRGPGRRRAASLARCPTPTSSPPRCTRRCAGRARA